MPVGPPTRRAFVAALSGAVAWPMVGGAQQAATLVVGFLNSGTPETSTDRDAAFRVGCGKSASWKAAMS